MRNLEVVLQSMERIALKRCSKQIWNEGRQSSFFLYFIVEIMYEMK